MDTRMDFQRLLEDMDKVIQAKRQELSELDERLESARGQLSDQEAKELTEQNLNEIVEGQANSQSSSGKLITRSIVDPHQPFGLSNEEQFQEQRRIYERQLEQFGDELTELESINQELVKENKFLRSEVNKSLNSYNELREKARILSKNLEEVHAANLELNLRLAKAESELQMQQKLLKKTHDEDEVLMDAFCDKLDSLKKAIEIRDAEIKRLRSDTQFAFETFGSIRGNTSDIMSNVHVGNGNEKDSRQVYYYSTDDGIVIDSDNKQKVIEIVSVFREKDSQIELLKSQLLQASKDLERNAFLVESLSAKLRMNNCDEKESELHELPLVVPTTAQGYSNNQKEKEKDQQELLARYKMLEKELDAKDQQLHLAEFRNHHYETILPNIISDLVQDLQATISRKNPINASSSVSNIDDEHLNKDILNKIETLTSNLNRLLSRMNMAQGFLDEIDRLRSVNHTKDEQIRRLVRELNQLDEGKFSSNPISEEENTVSVSHTNVSVENKSIQENIITETSEEQAHDAHLDEKAAHCRELATLKGSKPESIEQSDTNTDQQELQQADSIKPQSLADPIKRKLREEADSESNSERSIRQTQLDNHNLEQKTSESCTTTSPLSINSQVKLAKITHSSSKTIDNALLTAQNRLRQLENENELLELAMKEILLSLKWSDAQCSTILIDCPSLERLCQLIEAKYLAKSSSSSTSNKAHDLPLEPSGVSDDLFQLVVLKSELDLLRGQNEQLRAQMKSHRQDYLELLLQANNSVVSVESVKLELQEAGCQTEILEIESTETSQLPQGAKSPVDYNEMNEELELKTSNKRPKCRNCSRMIQLTNHLLQCIVRVEMRVSLGEEIYVGRLVNLHQLIRSLERDLSIRDRQLNEFRLESHKLTQSKLSVECKLNYLEKQMSTHLKTCPLTHLPQTAVLLTKGEHENLQVYTTAKNGKGDSIQSLTIQSRGISSNSAHQQRQPARQESQAQNPQLTIALLQSIIGCLQARIDYKDERLKQLELLILSQAKENRSRQTTRVPDHHLRVNDLNFINQPV